MNWTGWASRGKFVLRWRGDGLAATTRSKLDLNTADEVFAILEKYYPRQQIKPHAQFFVEELFEQIDQSK